MGLIPEQSFTVRKPAWWDNSGQFDLDEYPGRERAMELAGHDWDVIEVPAFAGIPMDVLAGAGMTEQANRNNGLLRKESGTVFHLRSDNLFTLAAHNASFERIPNHVAYDVAEEVIGQGYLYESAGSMDGGKENYLTMLLPEPFYISGDASATLPYLGLSWCHDGTGALRMRGTSVRQVCQNTVAASEAEGERLGTSYTIRHTKNWREKLDEIRKAVRGIRETTNHYVEKMEDLATIQVTPEQRDLFVSHIIGDEIGEGLPLSRRADTSDRVKNNIEEERAKVLSLFMSGKTIPETHLLTGYGLHLAGVEYFDHLRAYRSRDSYVRRTLLQDNPAKASLSRTIREVAQVAA